MPWKSQGGGPWGGGGGGGQGPWGNPRPGGGGQPPDIEEMLRRSQEKFRGFMPKGGGGARGFILVIVAAVLIWLGTGFYRVQPGEQGIELLFGEYVKLTSPGLNYWFPSPVGEAIVLNTEKVNSIEIGFRGSETGRTVRDVKEESLMLTSDQNIIDIDFIVQWQIKNAADFLFNIRDPQTTIKLAAESALREIVGQTPLESALTTQRQEVEDRTQDLLQQILDFYGSGVLITDVKQDKVDPPSEVIDAFNDVQRAKQDQERLQNEAIKYRNDIVPRAKGQAQRIIQDATAYKERIIKEAEGEAERFLSVYNTYVNAKDVTTRRLFLERMQQIMSDSEKIIIDTDDGGSGVVPYLPLNELRKSGSTGGSQ